MEITVKNSNGKSNRFIFSKNQLRMNLQLNYNKMETNKNKEWLNITVKQKRIQNK